MGEPGLRPENPRLAGNAGGAGEHGQSGAESASGVSHGGQALCLPVHQPAGRLSHVSAIAGNHSLIPPERVFAQTLERSVAFVVLINIDKTVTF